MAGNPETERPSLFPSGKGGLSDKYYVSSRDCGAGTATRHLSFHFDLFF